MSVSDELINKNERRQQSYQLIAKLKSERLELWALYSEIAQLKPFPVNADLKKKLVKFSQILIDYISMGHFGVYEHLLSGAERRDRILKAAQEIYPGLSISTQVAELFNEKYEHLDEFETFDDLEQDLSSLGENLALRIELEDKFCQLMM